MPVTVAWMSRAACLSHDVDIFFNLHTTHQARRICSGCSVRTECLEYGLNEPDGVWGGMSPYERNRLTNNSRKTLPSTVRGSRSSLGA